jgi:hypothetical protein
VRLLASLWRLTLRVYPSRRGAVGARLRSAVVGACLAALALAAPAHAAFPGANGKIAFHTDRDGNGEIYTMNADGFEPDQHHEQPSVRRVSRLVSGRHQDRVLHKSGRAQSLHLLHRQLRDLHDQRRRHEPRPAHEQPELRRGARLVAERQLHRLR